MVCFDRANCFDVTSVTASTHGRFAFLVSELGSAWLGS